MAVGLPNKTRSEVFNPETSAPAEFIGPHTVLPEGYLEKKISQAEYVARQAMEDRLNVVESTGYGD